MNFGGILLFLNVIIEIEQFVKLVFKLINSNRERLMNLVYEIIIID